MTNKKFSRGHFPKGTVVTIRGKLSPDGMTYLKGGEVKVESILCHGPSQWFIYYGPVGEDADGWTSLFNREWVDIADVTGIIKRPDIPVRYQRYSNRRMVPEYPLRGNLRKGELPYTASIIFPFDQLTENQTLGRILDSEKVFKFLKSKGLLRHTGTIKNTANIRIYDDYAVKLKEARKLLLKQYHQFFHTNEQSRRIIACNKDMVAV